MSKELRARPRSSQPDQRPSEWVSAFGIPAWPRVCAGRGPTPRRPWGQILEACGIQTRTFLRAAFRRRERRLPGCEVGEPAREILPDASHLTLEDRSRASRSGMGGRRGERDRDDHRDDDAARRAVHMPSETRTTAPGATVARPPCRGIQVDSRCKSTSRRQIANRDRDLNRSQPGEPAGWLPILRHTAAQQPMRTGSLSRGKRRTRVSATGVGRPRTGGRRDHSRCFRPARLPSDCRTGGRIDRR